jgi:hypothetical protein
MYRNEADLRLDILIVVSAAPGITDTALPRLLHEAEVQRMKLGHGATPMTLPSVAQVESNSGKVVDDLLALNLIEDKRFVRDCREWHSYMITPTGEAMKQLFLRR